MKSRGTQLLNSNSICAEGQEYMNWIPINELKNHTIYPTFFTEKLINIPNQVEHIVTRAIKTIKTKINLIFSWVIAHHLYYASLDSL